MYEANKQTNKLSQNLFKHRSSAQQALKVSLGTEALHSRHWWSLQAWDALHGRQAPCMAGTFNFGQALFPLLPTIVWMRGLRVQWDYGRPDWIRGERLDSWDMQSLAMLTGYTPWGGVSDVGHFAYLSSGIDLNGHTFKSLHIAVSRLILILKTNSLFSLGKTV